MLPTKRSSWKLLVRSQGRPQVHESVLISGRDALLIAIPFGLILLVQFFRLDELVAKARPSKNAARRFCGPDAVGDMVLTDPDGRTARTSRPQGRRADSSPGQPEIAQ
jgi:hypothetical protein